MKTRLKMKDLEAATGVGRETIRYYIREGLLPEPERPGRNVAWYDESFIDRISMIKELQRKRFLPLQMIKTILDSGAPVTPEQAVVIASLDGNLFRGDGRPEPGVRLAHAAERAHVPASELLELAAVGVLRVETHDGDQWLDPASARIAELWGTLRAAGFSKERGLTPQRMKLYVDFVALLAREEIRLFTGTVGANVDAQTAARLGEVGVETLNEMLAHMRKAAVLNALGELNMPADGDVTASAEAD